MALADILFSHGMILVTDSSLEVGSDLVILQRKVGNFDEYTR